MIISNFNNIVWLLYNRRPIKKLLSYTLYYYYLYEEDNCYNNNNNKHTNSVVLNAI